MSTDASLLCTLHAVTRLYRKHNMARDSQCLSSVFWNLNEGRHEPNTYYYRLIISYFMILMVMLFFFSPFSNVSFQMQINYLLDEAFVIRKGSQLVITLLHHFFKNYGLKERIVDLHCDNCGGQNKNKFLIWYLMWRVITGRHDQITLNFMLTGHTKFLPDGCFGLIKQRYKKTPVSCMADIAKIVKDSTRSCGMNIPHVFGEDVIDGEVGRERKWCDFPADYFTPVPKIKTYHHFR